MKDLIKSICIFVISLFTSVIVYPFLHELGHSIIAVFVGARLIEINLFPIPNIIYENANGSNIKNLLIGFGGVVLPSILSLSIKTKKFWLWYANFILKSICLLSMGISILSIIFEKSQIFIQDDMRTILRLWSESKSICLIVLICMTIILSFDIYKEYSSNRSIIYFKL